jgi:biotin carboxyl carrier protein
MSEQKEEFVDFAVTARKYKTQLTTKYKNRKPFEPVNPNDVYSSIPGTVNKFFVKEGDFVKEGEPILILEAMKMENIIRMPYDGIIKKIHVSDGVRIPKNSLMLELEEK